MAPDSEAGEAIEALVRQHRGSPDSPHISRSSAAAGHDGEGEGEGDGDARKSGEKESKILDACKWTDVPGLRALAESEGGFLNDGLRRAACTFLRTICLLSMSPPVIAVEFPCVLHRLTLLRLEQGQSCSGCQPLKPPPMDTPTLAIGKISRVTETKNR